MIDRGGGQVAFHEGLARLPPRSTQARARDVSVSVTCRRHLARDPCDMSSGREPARHAREHALIIFPYPPLRSFTAQERVPLLSSLPGV